MTNEQRREYDNLLLLCGTHHTIIDADVDQWTVATLHDLKRAHEASATVISQAAAELRASAPVLPIDAMVTDGPPFVGREVELERVALHWARPAMRSTALWLSVGLPASGRQHCSDRRRRLLTRPASSNTFSLSICGATKTIPLTE